MTSFLMKYLPVLLEIYKEYKRWQHDRQVKKIKQQPTEEWNDLFGHSTDDKL